MSKRFIALSTAAAVAGAAAFAGAAWAQSRDQIRVVGSSTVYPFTTAVAEQFGKTGGGKTPVVESTGTGGGFKLFCAGVGVGHPDVSNASRRIKKSEFDDCQKNGATDIIEIKIGFDGITIAQSKAGTPLKLTMAQVFLAVADQVPDKDGKLVANPNKSWSDIDKALPNVKIEVLGPPPTSGTRDAFHELFMEVGALQVDALKELRKADSKAFDKVWKSIRRDGAYVEAGENDNVIVAKLEANKNAFGIFGYSFLEENTNKLRGVTIEGVEPSFEAIASGKYKGSRPLFIYVKKQHIGIVPGLDKFVAEYVSDKSMGKDGYLSRKGLVPLPSSEAAEVRKAALAQTTLSGAGL
ncbi:MAG TPA: PstS family phosphate ABC transporter substrate-binding protein [Hyphomicrobiaceae bacterium]|nr:PstS family phosphate ABC transporter substrate-binding protein [Hyphomicrobiaceae bacterium]